MSETSSTQALASIPASEDEKPKVPDERLLPGAATRRGSAGGKMSGRRESWTKPT